MGCYFLGRLVGDVTRNRGLQILFRKNKNAKKEILYLKKWNKKSINLPSMRTSKC